MHVHSLILALLLAVVSASDALAASCGNSGRGLGVSRVIEIDASGGPLFGDMTKYAKEESFLAPKEVVLTFDDGPMPWITKSILDSLDAHCTKATFFSVGRMAVAYPRTVRDVMARGHTLGTHTWSHPLNLPRMSLERAREEMERGFTAVALAAGQPIAPFFRFPGLSDSPALLAHLQSRQVASFTVDVVSNDSFIGDTGRLIDRTLRHVEARKGGIVLFHDIKAVTARALPTILSELHARGYKVVHLRSKHTHKPDDSYRDKLEPQIAKALGTKELPVFYAGMAAPSEREGANTLPVAELAPQPKTFAVAALDNNSGGRGSPKKPRTRVEKLPSVNTWSTSVKRDNRGSIFD